MSLAIAAIATFLFFFWPISVVAAFRLSHHQNHDDDHNNHNDDHNNNHYNGNNDGDIRNNHHNKDNNNVAVEQKEGEIHSLEEG